MQTRYDVGTGGFGVFKNLIPVVVSCFVKRKGVGFIQGKFSVLLDDASNLVAKVVLKVVKAF